MIHLDVDEPVRDSLVIAAFEGWNDAAEAATDVVEHLLVEWRGRQVGALDPDDFYDFQVNRPHVATTDAGRRELSWRTTRIWLCEYAPGDRPVVLVTGIEPNLRWRSFCDVLLAALHELGMSHLALLGTLLADVPHSRPVHVTGHATDESLADRLSLEPTHYSGPTGITGVLTHLAAERGVDTLSCWAAVPHYVAHPPAPKTVLALLGMIEELVGEPVDHRALEEDARAWERGVDDLAASDDEVADYVRGLERDQDEADLPQASGDAIAREFERYLRRRDGG